MNDSALPSATFGPYRALRVIGRGGAGVVVEAVHTRTGRRVAIKTLAGAHAEQPVIVARFEREARIIAHLEHPHVVAAHEVGVEAGRPYLVMEMLDGETLAMRDRCASTSRRSPPCSSRCAPRSPRRIARGSSTAISNLRT